MSLPLSLIGQPLRRRVFPRVVPALAYHKVAPIPAGARYDCNYVKPSEFSAQLGYLRTAGYTSISFATYISYRQGNGQLPRRPVLITFDDGYRSNLEIALPILQRFGFTATIFLVTDLLGKTNSWDADELQEPLLSVADMRLMQRAGIDFQSHTCSHPRLTRLDASDAYRELLTSRLSLENIVQTPVSVVAYPWGDEDASVRALASRAGYAAGVILRRRTNFDDTPLLQLRRIGINHQTTRARFGWDLARLRLRGA